MYRGQNSDAKVVGVIPPGRLYDDEMWNKELWKVKAEQKSNV